MVKLAAAPSQTTSFADKHRVLDGPGRLLADQPGVPPQARASSSPSPSWHSGLPRAAEQHVGRPPDSRRGQQVAPPLRLPRWSGKQFPETCYSSGPTARIAATSTCNVPHSRPPAQSGVAGPQFRKFSTPRTTQAPSNCRAEMATGLLACSRLLIGSTWGRPSTSTCNWSCAPRKCRSANSGRATRTARAWGGTPWLVSQQPARPVEDAVFVGEEVVWLGRPASLPSIG